MSENILTTSEKQRKQIRLTVDATGPHKADGQDTTRIEIDVRDQSGRPVGDREILTALYFGLLDGGTEFQTAEHVGEGRYVAEFSSRAAGFGQVIAVDAETTTVAETTVVFLSGEAERLIIEVDSRPFTPDGIDFAEVRAWVVDANSNELPDKNSEAGAMMPACDVFLTADKGHLSEFRVKGGVFRGKLRSTEIGMATVIAVDRISGCTASTEVPFPIVSFGPPQPPVLIDPDPTVMMPISSLPIEFCIPPEKPISRYELLIEFDEDHCELCEAIPPFSGDFFTAPEFERIAPNLFKITGSCVGEELPIGKMQAGELWFKTLRKGEGIIDLKEIKVWGTEVRPIDDTDRVELIEAPIDFPPCIIGFNKNHKKVVKTITVNAYVVKGGTLANPKGGSDKTDDDISNEMKRMNDLFCRLCKVRIKEGKRKTIHQAGLEDGLEYVGNITKEMKDLIKRVPKPNAMEVNLFFLKQFVDGAGTVQKNRGGTALGAARPGVTKDMKNNVFIGDKVTAPKDPDDRTKGTEVLDIDDTITADHEFAHVVINTPHVNTGDDDDGDGVADVKNTNVLQNGDNAIRHGTNTDHSKITMTKKQCERIENFP